VQFRKKLTLQQFTAFMAQQAPYLVIFEACGGTHYWAREMEALGHAAKLIAPPYVRPFVKRQKNDAADANASAIAARQAEMRFVEAKTVEQHSHAAVFRGRELLVHQRIADVNALRALLYEHGCVFPIGMRYLDRMGIRPDRGHRDHTEMPMQVGPNTALSPLRLVHERRSLRNG
jgi:transposase